MVPWLSRQAREILTLATTLVTPPGGEPGVQDVDAVTRLRAVAGGRPALLEAAQFVRPSTGSGYPASRIYRLLLEAADAPLPAMTAEEAAVEEREKKLSTESASVSFEQLAEQVPALRALEQQARTASSTFLTELSPVERLMFGGLQPRGRGSEEFRITAGIKKAVQRLLGPSSGQSDPVLASRAAANAVEKYLWEVAGIDPHNWGPSPND
jgi:hypothetical protein